MWSSRSLLFSRYELISLPMVVVRSAPIKNNTRGGQEGVTVGRRCRFSAMTVSPRLQSHRCKAHTNAAAGRRNTRSGSRTHVLPGNLIISAGQPLCCSAWTSLLHCVVFPALSTPSSTISAPRFNAIDVGCVSAPSRRSWTGMRRLLSPG